MTKLTPMDQNLLGDQILVLDMVFLQDFVSRFKNL